MRCAADALAARFFCALRLAALLSVGRGAAATAAEGTAAAVAAAAPSAVAAAVLSSSPSLRLSAKLALRFDRLDMRTETPQAGSRRGCDGLAWCARGRAKTVGKGLFLLAGVAPSWQYDTASGGKMDTLLSSALLLTAALVSASSACSSDYTAGESSCPCRDSVDLSNFLNSEGTALRPATNDHVLPTDYGLLCGQHDAWGSYCLGSDAAYCKQTWCWVDPHNCNGSAIKNSTWFPGSYAYYSYATCGSEDSFSESGTFDTMPYRVPQTTNLAPPLRKVTSCMDLASPSDPCGPLVKGRVQFNNDWCALEQQVESS